MTGTERTDGGTVAGSGESLADGHETDRPIRRTVDHRPSSLASVLSVALAACSVALVATGPVQTQSLLIVVVGLFILGVGYRSREGLVSVVRIVIGLAIVLAGIQFAIAADLGRIGDAELLPGLYGLTVLGLGLLPVRRGWETRFATLGVTLVLVSVLFSGITRDAGVVGILAATAAGVAAWDAARHAITLGEQVGRAAATPRAELVHVAATGVVGLGTVAVAVAVWRLQVTDLPLVGLVFLLGAGVALLFYLYD
ncbi:hypothetical protein BV210_01580 [Halorientalis sp. IM1011]|uniref:DUF7519 family protein n=1 Tax=Halorientalis sp. IM1011 TaxID=1932360 RepID=UPI00097CC4DE|nr:hypothetical protein [Halorientalis sp. IM1011]AQL41483.1 hypothetical protein BV210_01580 [Halorientalis sp. IM1011]